MTVYENREAFIPYSRKDIIQMCLEDGNFKPTDIQKFQDFCLLLSAYYHFKLHHTMEKLKENYAPFNPDADTKSRTIYTKAQLTNMEANVVKSFKTILEQANYAPVSKKILQKAFDAASLIELKTDVNFDDFDQMVCYYRGDTDKTILVKKLWKKVSRKVDIFERVALLIKCKNYDYFEAQKVNVKKLHFTPGQMYIYLYKNIPEYDLEFLFPNVKVSMTLKDRLFLGVPAVGAAIPLLVKILPQLLLIIGVIILIVFGPDYTEQLNLKPNQEDVKDVMRILVATFSLLVALGGFAFKQYTKYKNKLIKFQKDVTETLFFKSLALNGGVFQSLIDAAEEEECKEIILAYYHLLTSDMPLTPEQLDDKIEEWMDRKFDTKIDFDIKGPLNNLTQIQGKVIGDGESEENTSDIPLLTYDERGCCQILPIDDAKQLIDYVWDNAFRYA
ncbi:MAG: TMEM143 family protein [Microcoleaceae cyanobacterium]